jgi:hypothetical protein
MKISLEFNNIKELEEFVSLFKTQQATEKKSPVKVDELVDFPEQEIVSKKSEPEKPLPKGILRERKLSSRGLKFRQQIMRAIKYSKKHKITFSKAIRKLYKRYAGNRDYDIAEKLGYPNLRKKNDTHYEEITNKNFFMTRRTKILVEIGWEHDEAEKAAIEAWELGERDPDNFSKTKSTPQRRS